MSGCVATEPEAQTGTWIIPIRLVAISASPSVRQYRREEFQRRVHWATYWRLPETGQQYRAPYGTFTGSTRSDGGLPGSRARTFSKLPVRKTSFAILLG